MKRNEGEFSSRVTRAVLWTVFAAVMLIATVAAEGGAYSEMAWAWAILPLVAGFMYFRGVFGRIAAATALLLLGYGVFVVVGDAMMSAS